MSSLTWIVGGMGMAAYAKAFGVGPFYCISGQEGAWELTYPKDGLRYVEEHQTQISARRAAQTDYEARLHGLNLQALPPVEHVAVGDAEKIALLEERIASLEDDLDEARNVPWPAWATDVIKAVRKHSGYDGYDDATEGVDVVGEVEETLSELQSENERLRAALASSEGRE